MHLVGYLYEDCHDARSLELKGRLSLRRVSKCKLLKYDEEVLITSLQRLYAQNVFRGWNAP